MYRTKKDIDSHVESLSSKLSLKEFTSRGYSIGRLYYEVGDYVNCCRYVERYLHVHNSNAAAHALLGQAMQKLGKMKQALEEFKTSYELCPIQNSLVLNICEILADDKNIDPGRSKYWCEKAEKAFPKHPVVFQLRQKLLSVANPDTKALIDLLLEELAVRPKDVLLHIRLIKLYLKNDDVDGAFTHSCNTEFGENNFNNNIEWYETITQVLKCNPRNENDWLFQLLLLTVKERVCVLSVTQTLSHHEKSIFESTELLHVYDQAIERVAKAGISSGYGEFHALLLKHHRSQFSFIAATLLLKRGIKHNWRDAALNAEPLMLLAWHSSIADPKTSWVISAPEIQQKAVRRWYTEGSYRCSQSGHYLLSNYNDKSQSLLDRISQNCSGTHWGDKLYGKIFSSRYHLEKINTSHLISTSFDAPALILPKRSEVETHDLEGQRAYGYSLHHFVWLLSKYKDFSQFQLTTFDMLPLTNKNDANCGPETLCQLDVYAFLYCATSTSRLHKINHDITSGESKSLPANITELLCSLSQLKWWDCAYKFSQNELGVEMTDIRATLSRGIEVVRCIDNHGIDPELLCDLGRIFGNRATLGTDTSSKRSWEERAVLYYTSAITLLEKHNHEAITKPDKPLFENVSRKPRDTSSLLEECKLYVALYKLSNEDFEKAIELLLPLKSSQALYHLSVTYKSMAMNDNQNNTNGESISMFLTLLNKAQKCAYEAHYKLKNLENESNHVLLMEIEELIDELNIYFKTWSTPESDKQGKNSSDEYFSIQGNEDVPLKTQLLFSKNFSSTPKYMKNSSKLITDLNSNQTFSGPSGDKLESNSLKRDTGAVNAFIELTRSVFEENRLQGNQIISTINSNMQSTTNQLAMLKISVDQVKEQIDECRKECKEVGDLKKQIAELKKDIYNMKKASEQTMHENETFNLDEGYAANEAASTFAAQLPFTAQQVMPPFNQRLLPPFTMPPNPFQVYGQNWFNLYSQFSQPTSVPGAPPIFDAARAQVNYPGVFANPDQMYLDTAHLVQPTAVPVIPTQATVPSSVAASTLSVAPATASITTSIVTQNVKAKDSKNSLPANVVITSSDPLPTCTTAPAPVLSVTVPPKHIKGIPHNYQIQMPSTDQTPAFSFPSLANKISPNTVSSNWTQNAVYHVATPTTNPTSSEISISFSPNISNTSINEEVSTNAANDSRNKSRTYSEKSNTSVDNYDPCPDFKPIIPLPAEVKVTTGEENETAIFTARAKLFRFVDNQWKERGLGEMKLLKHNVTGKVRVLMRREQIHKICANHAITSYMEIKPMKNDAKAYFWVANDFADETLVLEMFSVRFKTADIARQFYETFEKARSEATTTEVSSAVTSSNLKSSKTGSKSETAASTAIKSIAVSNSQSAKTVFGGFTFSSPPAFKAVGDAKIPGKTVDNPPKVNVFSGLSFSTGPTTSPFSNLLSTSSSPTNSSNTPLQNTETTEKFNASDTVEEYEPTGEFTPVVPLPALVDTKTGEEDEIILFEHRAKLLRFVAKEWKERGLGNIKLLVHKDNPQKLRLLMRRDQVMKVCCNHAVTKTMTFQKMPNIDKAVTWCAQDFSEGELTPETFCLRFKTVQACNDFIDAVKAAQSKLKDDSKAAKEESNAAKQNSQIGMTNVSQPVNSIWGDKLKPKQRSCECKDFVRNEGNVEICPACNSPNIPGSGTAKTNTAESKITSNNEIKIKFDMSLQSNTPIKSSWGEKFKPAAGTWGCKQCLVRNEGSTEICCACSSPKDPNAAAKTNTAESKDTSNNEIKFKFGIPQQSNSVKAEEQKLSKTSIKSSWGEKFKPADGTWECKQCFVRNEGSTEICCACSSPKDPNAAGKTNTAESKDTSNNEIKFKFGIPQQSNSVKAEEQKLSKTSIKSSWGEKFKPADGTWECKQCFVRNEGSTEICCACSSPKDPNAAAKTNTAESKDTSNNGIQFKFGIPQQSNSVKAEEQRVSNTSIKSSWGEKFKPADGTWECKQCFVRNEGSTETCYACSSPKDPSAASKPVTANTPWSTPKFSFSIIPATPDSNEKKAVTTSIFDGTGAHKFNFGTPPNLQAKSSDSSLRISTASDVLTVGTGITSDATQKATLTQKENRAALLPTPQKPRETPFFYFVYKPETQTKAKSPTKSPKPDDEEDSDGNDYASEDEGHHIHVTPIVPLPDKVKVVTGEEDEDELFAHRAKLLIFVSGEWKERGLGIVKILKHKQTSKLRVVMRREQVFKICLNHALTSDITYNLKDEKNWIFAANDFSEGELTMQRFCLKFKTKEIAMQFKDAVDQARSGKSNQPQPMHNTMKSETENDVEFINETESNSEEKKKALELMLPANFFLYKNRDPCPGCRGCDNDKDSKTPASKSIMEPSAFAALKTFFNSKTLSGVNSAYLTRDNINAPKFGTTTQETFSQLGQGTNSTTETVQKPIFVSADKSDSIISGPKLNSAALSGSQLTTTSQSLQSDPKSIFATANSSLSSSKNSAFGFKLSNNGNSEVKSVFGQAMNSNLNDNEKPDTKSVFGFPSDVKTQKSFNLFSQNDGKGNDSPKPVQTLAFTSLEAPNYFGNGKSIWTFDSKTDSKPPVNDKSELVKLLNATKADDKSSENPATEVLGADNSLSFSAFKSKPELTFQKNPDFKWEGAGQQLFAQASKSNNSGDDENEADAGNGAEEEYDPHYEPIVPLPDKITVTTGEEDEEKLFGSRCKLFRYDDATREWKERGVGELKILYHPEKKTYRLLFRREQVHKAVLNMLLFMDLELLPMSKSDRAWTWAGINYAENPAGDQETLAVRFKTMQIATEFFDKVKECVRKLQAAAAQAIREQKEAEEKPTTEPIALLKLPKGMQESSRVDRAIAMQSEGYGQSVEASVPLETASSDLAKRVLFHEPEQTQQGSDEDVDNYDEHEQVYYQGDDYDTYYNEEEESNALFSCDCEAEVSQGSAETACAQAYVQVMFDHAMYVPKIEVTNLATGELLADMLIHDDTEFQLSDATCSWSGTDFTNNDPLESTVTLTFPDSDTAMQFYETCESSKEHHSGDADTEA